MNSQIFSEDNFPPPDRLIPVYDGLLVKVIELTLERFEIHGEDLPLIRLRVGPFTKTTACDWLNEHTIKTFAVVTTDDPELQFVTANNVSSARRSAGQIYGKSQVKKVSVATDIELANLAQRQAAHVSLRASILGLA